MNRFRLAVLLPTLCITLSACAKKADPVVLPAVDEINAVLISENETLERHTDQEWIEGFVSAVKKARATRRTSVQDAPDVEHFKKIDVEYDGGADTMYFYEDGGKYCLEQPYQGIYFADPSLTKMICTDDGKAGEAVTADTGKAGDFAPAVAPEPAAYSGLEEAALAEMEEIEEVEIIFNEGETAGRKAVSDAALEERLENTVNEMLMAKSVSIQLSEEGALISIKIRDGVMPTEKQQEAVKKLVERSVKDLTPDRISLEIDVPRQSKGEPGRLRVFHV